MKKKVAGTRSRTERKPRAVVTESVLDELQQMEDRIMRGAYDIFEKNGRSHGRDLQDWLDAERELVWKPPIDLREEGREIVVTIAVPGVDPKDLDIQATPAHLLIKAPARHEHKEGECVHTCEFLPGNLFRSVTFPKRIDPARIKTSVVNGLLQVRAAVADRVPTGPVKRRVS